MLIKKRSYVTGTTQGLGEVLQRTIQRWMEVEYLEYYDVQCVGLDRPEYNLDNSIEAYVRDDFEVYVLNAHYEFSQVELLYRLFEENKDRDCHIIVIGSVSADGDRKEINRYAVEKAAIDKAVQQLQLVESVCKVSCIKPGRMKTQMTEHRAMFYRMNPEHIASAVMWMIEQPKFLNVKTLTLDVHHTAKEIH